MLKMRTESSFESYKNDILIGYKRDFEIRYRNGARIAIWDKDKNLGGKYINKLTDEEMKQLWVFSCVKKAAVSYIKKNPKFAILPNKLSVQKNYQAIDSMAEGEIFYATDADHCYLRSAFLQDIINENLYLKLCDSKYKLLRNKALACITSKEKVEYYVKGVLSRTEFTGDPKLHSVYLNIRNFSYDVMDLCRIVSKEYFLKYRTDCVYYTKGARRQVEKMLRAKDMPFKTNECTYIGNRMFIENDDVKSL